MRAGLRAELAPANLFPGSLAVTLEMRPEAAPVEQQRPDVGLPEIPTTGVPLEPLGEKMKRIAGRIEALPLEETVARLNGLIEAAKRLVESPAVAGLLTNLAEGSRAWFRRQSNSTRRCMRSAPWEREPASSCRRLRH